MSINEEVFMFQSLLKELEAKMERVFNRKLKDSAVVKDVETLKVEVDLNKSIIKALLEHQSNTANPEPTFKKGEVVMVRDEDRDVWKVRLFKCKVGNLFRSTTDADWSQCRKLNDEEKGV